MILVSLQTCCHEWRFLSAIKNQKICANGSFSVHVWVSRTSGLLFKTRKIVSRCKKKMRYDLKNCTASFTSSGPWSHYSSKPQRETRSSFRTKGKQDWEKELTEAKHECSRYVWSHQSSSRKDHVLFLLTRESGFLSNRNEGGHQLLYIGSQALAPGAELDKYKSPGSTPRS